MNKPMAMTEEKRAQVALYIRMSLGAGLLGIGYGYYLQVMDRLEMTGIMHFEMAIRGIIIGAFFWGLQIFVLNGRAQERLRAMTYGPKVFLKTIAYLAAIGVGYLIGDFLFEPGKYLGS